MPSLEDLPPALRRQLVSRLRLRQGMDASPIFRGLHQGWAPPAGPLLRQAGFDMIVLCAEEWQPPGFADETCSQVLGYTPQTDPYPGVALVHAPNDDDFQKPPSREVLAQALKAASYAAYRVAHGGRVLVSCWAGINRSGLVSALTLHKLTGLAGRDCIAVIQKARPQALRNPQFVSLLNRIQATQRPTFHR